MVERAQQNPKIAWELWQTVTDVHADDDGKVNAVTLTDTRTGDERQFPCQGLFVAIGHTPNTQVFQGKIDMDDKGYVITTPGRSFTSVEGVFAAGDVADSIYRQAVTAAGSGCMAAIDCERWLEEQEHAS